jgi:hypothetical protein
MFLYTNEHKLQMRGAHHDIMPFDAKRVREQQHKGAPAG